jgi:hypothetical protein
MGKVAENLLWAEMVAYHLLAYAMVEVQEADLSCLMSCLMLLHLYSVGSSSGTMRLPEEVVGAAPSIFLCFPLHLQSHVLSLLLAFPRRIA